MKDFNIGTMTKYNEFCDARKGKLRAPNVTFLAKRNLNFQLSAKHQTLLRTQRETKKTNICKQRARSRSRNK